MLFSKAKGHKVVSSSSADTVAKVSRFVVDPTTRSVVAMEVKKSKDGDVLRWSDITAFGSDAVTITDESRIGDGGEDVKALTGKAHRVLGKRVLSTGGDELGKVDDVDFDAATGELRFLLLTGGAGEAEVNAARLIGVGSFAVVVREAAPQ